LFYVLKQDVGVEYGFWVDRFLQADPERRHRTGSLDKKPMGFFHLDFGLVQKIPSVDKRTFTVLTGYGNSFPGLRTCKNPKLNE